MAISRYIYINFHNIFRLMCVLSCMLIINATEGCRILLSIVRKKGKEINLLYRCIYTMLLAQNVNKYLL